MRCTSALVLLLVASCALDLPEADTGEIASEVVSANRLSANRLSANRLSANRLSANRLSANGLSSAEVNALAATEGGREVLQYIVACALLPTQTLVVTLDDGSTYRYDGEIGLAPAWLDNVPTVEERRWVTACLMARTNLYGVSVDISMRGAHAMLYTTQTEVSTYKVVEGGYYGDLFDPAGPTMYACSSKTYSKTLADDPVRACSLSQDGITTECGFSYTGLCNAYEKTYGLPAACDKASAPYGDCHGGGVTHGEVITIFLAQ